MFQLNNQYCSTFLCSTPLTLHTNPDSSCQFCSPRLSFWSASCCFWVSSCLTFSTFHTNPDSSCQFCSPHLSFRFVSCLGVKCLCQECCLDVSKVWSSFQIFGNPQFITNFIKHMVSKFASIVCEHT